MLRCLALALVLASVALPGAAAAQTASATWLGAGATPDWNDPANWDTGVVPDNGNGGFDWDVAVSAAGAIPDPVLSQDVTLASITVERARIALGGHTLTIEGTTTMVETSVFSFPRASFEAGTLLMNGPLELMGEAEWAGFYDMLVVHAGHSVWQDPALWLSDQTLGASTFRNEGILEADEFEFRVASPQAQAFQLENYGTIVQHSGALLSYGNFENHGLIDVTYGLNFTAPNSSPVTGTPLDSLRQVAGTLSLGASGHLQNSFGKPVFAIEGGRVEGITLSFLPLEVAGVFAAGPREGTGVTQVDVGAGAEDFVMLPGGVLEIELGGTTVGEFDRVIGDNIRLDGELHVSFVNGFAKTVTAADSLLIISSSDGLEGEFSNVADRQDLVSDGVRFRVDYHANSVVLSEFELLPRRSCALGPELAAVLPLLAGLRRARRVRPA